MAKTMRRLTPQGIKALTKPGLYPDGGNLYVQVSPSGTKSWAFVYRFGPKTQKEPEPGADPKPAASGSRTWQLGLGSLATVTLKEARERAEEGRRLLAEKPAKNPKVIWAAKTEGVPTFKAAAEAYLETRDWRSEKQHQQVKKLLLTGPRCAMIANVSVDAITTEIVKKVLMAPVPARRDAPAGAFWMVRRATASKLRGHIEAILASEKALGHIHDPWANPARWRDCLKPLLPRPKKTEHYRALPHAELPALMAELRAIGEDLEDTGCMAALALQFVILTATRANEVLSAEWSEIDLQGRVWSVPPSRTKMQKLHRTPLSGAAMAILEAVPRLDEKNSLIFPSTVGRPIDVGNLGRLLERLGRKELTTVHGMRTAFRGWCAETGCPWEIAEHALAHAVGNTTSRAYDRGDAFTHRVALMTAWANFLSSPPDEGGAADADVAGDNVVDFPVRQTA